jgi:flagellar basal body-associated protein FliL
MGLIKILLKAIIIPIVLVLVIGVIIVFAVKMHREKKQKKKEIQQTSFQPPPIQQWSYPISPGIQKPAAVASYGVNTRSQMEQSVARS